MKGHYPYKAEIGWQSSGKDIWWPVSSNPDDNMVIGDQIPGDKQSAELCARCCNIAYRHAMEDVLALFKESGMNIEKFLKKLDNKR